MVDEEEDGRFTWALRAELSNAFLQRLARRVQSVAQVRARLDGALWIDRVQACQRLISVVAQPLTPAAATSVGKSVAERMLPSPTARTNVSGEREDLATYIVNHIAALLSDMGVAM